MDRPLDTYDLRILEALQSDGAMTNNMLADIVHLSASQCSRRRAALEASGVIEGYQARLSAEKLGMGLRAIVRLNMKTHDRESDAQLSNWLALQPEVEAAFSVSGDADYILTVRLPDLESFSVFIHEKLIIQPQIAQVRSDFVLRTLKDSAVLNLRLAV